MNLYMIIHINLCASIYIQINIYANFRLFIYIHIYFHILAKKNVFSISKYKENFICRTAYLIPVERHYFL